MRPIQSIAMSDYSQLPFSPSVSTTPFRAHVPEEKLQHFRQLLSLSPVAPAVHENTKTNSQYAVRRDWLLSAKEIWLNNETFSWRSHELRINSFPNFKASVIDSSGSTLDIQFLALFSNNTNAVPITFLHGFPGSICEFLDILDLLKAKYTPQDLPYHVIIPSLPGYGYSSSPRVEVDYTIEMAASALNNLMKGLGFGNGYLVQGGDLGSFIARALATRHEECKGCHFTMVGVPPSALGEPEKMTQEEKDCMAKAQIFIAKDYAAAAMQATRSSTVGLVLGSSPLALLAWVGEKMIDWADEALSLGKILEGVTLYWMTDVMARGIWHSRELLPEKMPLLLPYVEKPCGYSLFAKELVPVPKTWAEKSCNLVFFNKHERGGHFAAMERSQELLADVEEYVRRAWKTCA